jgi:hypothetical protein
MRENYPPLRSNSSGGLGMSGLPDRSSDIYGAEREAIFALGQGGGGPATRGGGGGGGGRNLSLSSPVGSGAAHPNSYGNFIGQHSDQTLSGISNNPTGAEQRDRFSDLSRTGSESHLGLYSSTSPSPLASQHISYDNASLNSSYDSESRTFPSHPVTHASSRQPAAPMFLRNLEPPQTVSHTSSPQIFHAVLGSHKPKLQIQIESPSINPKYSNFVRPGLHELDQSSPTNSQFAVQLPSPKFDPSKWV